MSRALRNDRRGRTAEALALLLLRIKGYRPLARRFRSTAGEIDLIVRRGRRIVYVEVKARGATAAAAESVGPRQRRRIGRAAAHFLKLRPDLAALEQRFDVVLIAPRTLPRHIVDAWRE